jgi:hypothetical protein
MGDTPNLELTICLEPIQHQRKMMNPLVVRYAVVVEFGNDKSNGTTGNHSLETGGDSLAHKKQAFRIRRLLVRNLGFQYAGPTLEVSCPRTIIIPTNLLSDETGH